MPELALLVESRLQSSRESQRGYHRTSQIQPIFVDEYTKCRNAPHTMSVFYLRRVTLVEHLEREAISVLGAVVLVLATFGCVWCRNGSLQGRLPEDGDSMQWHSLVALTLLWSRTHDPLSTT